jgi:hypothetical protein
MRQNLQPKVEFSGLVMPLWFGSGVHYALAQYYNPILKRDPVETFLWWYDLQMNGGIIDEEYLDLVYDRKPQSYVHNGTVQYQVRGLFDLLPEYDLEQYEEHRELGIGMLNYYKEYAEEHDTFAVICEEHTFSVPIRDSSGQIYYAVDPRDGIRKQVHLRGTQDAIIQSLETGQFGILEHKTAVAIDEAYHRKLELDEQSITYLLAGQLEASIHGLEYEKLSFVLYNAIRKAFPRPPTPTKNGLFSINRQSESTTPRLLREYISSHGLDVVVETDERLKNYVDWVERQGDQQFIKRTYVRRNRTQIESCGKRIYEEARDMLDKNLRIYPNPTGDYSCLYCVFRAPCIAKEDGSDWQIMLNDEYELNPNR